MKVLIIDPWCANGSNLFYYTTGMAEGIAKNEEVDVTVAAAKNCTFPKDILYNYKNVFFGISNKLKRGKLRTMIRGMEYLWAYAQIYILVCKEQYDVIQVEWPLMYLADVHIFKMLKRKCSKFILKAHNVLPHSTGNTYIDIFRKIYRVPDVILLHGENLKQEFGRYYPEYMGKTVIQRFGIHMNHDKKVVVENIDNKILKRISKAEKVFLFCGGIHFDKGADRLISIWRSDFEQTNSLLVVAGEVNSNYPDFILAEGEMKLSPNILYIKGFVPDNMFNFLLSVANIVILPYRAGSMSGVAFSCAEFSKPLLCTNFGAINEYIQNGKTGFIVENTDKALAEKMVYINRFLTNTQLDNMGKALNQYFSNNYQWEVIGKKLVEEVYERGGFL